MATRDDVESALASVPMLQELSPKSRRKVAERGRIGHFESGRTVTEEGGGGVGFHIILAGTATVDVHGTRRREMGPGEYFGEITLLDGKPRSATVTAGPSGVTTWSLTKWEFDGLLDDEPSLARYMLQGLASRLREAQGPET